MKKLFITVLFGALMMGVASCGSTNQATDQGAAPAAEESVPAASALPPHMATIKGEVFEGEVPVNMKVANSTSLLETPRAGSSKHRTRSWSPSRRAGATTATRPTLGFRPLPQGALLSQ